MRVVRHKPRGDVPCDLETVVLTKTQDVELEKAEMKMPCFLLRVTKSDMVRIGGNVGESRLRLVRACLEDGRRVSWYKNAKDGATRQDKRGRSKRRLCGRNKGRVGNRFEREGCVEPDK